MKYAGSILGAVALLAQIALTQAFPSPARAADPWQDPFCSGSANAVPWNAQTNAPATAATSDTYLLWVFADGKTDVAAAVTFIGARNAYSATVTRTPLLRKGGTDWYYAQPVLVKFAKPVTIGYVYVDSVGIDGAAPTVCPTVVQPVTPFKRDPASPDRAPGVDPTAPQLTAKLLQALPPLTCGHVYSDAQLTSEGPIVGEYGSVARTTVVRAYVDSNGRTAGATLERSSGIEGLDDAALGGVEHGTFKPAEFLCTPVVSTVLVEMRYQP